MNDRVHPFGHKARKGAVSRSLESEGAGRGGKSKTSLLAPMASPRRLSRSGLGRSASGSKGFAQLWSKQLPWPDASAGVGIATSTLICLRRWRIRKAETGSGNPQAWLSQAATSTDASIAINFRFKLRVLVQGLLIRFPYSGSGSEPPEARDLLPASMADSPLFQSPGPACRLLPPSQGPGSPYGESPLLPGWRPPDWEPTAVSAWQASWSTDAGLNLSRPGASKEDVEQPEQYEEEIDRFLRSLDVGSSTQSSGIAGATASDGLPPGPCRERRSQSPPLLCRSERLSPADALQQLPEEAFVPDSPPRLRCGRCGRRFAAPRLEVHEAICFATVPVQRGVFESRRQRLEGFALPKPVTEVVARSRKNLPETTVAQPRPKAKSLPRKNSQPTTRSQTGAGRQKETQELCTPQRRPRPRGISSTPVVRPRRTSRSSASKVATEVPPPLNGASAKSNPEEPRSDASPPPRKSCDAAVAEADYTSTGGEPVTSSPDPISASPSHEAPSAVQESSAFQREDSHVHSLRWERITRALCFSEGWHRVSGELE
eukprot:s1561_g9.t1